EGIDKAVPVGRVAVVEIPDQQVVAEDAEVAGSQCQSPGGTERAARMEAAHEVAVRVEDVDEAAIRPLIGDEQLAAYVLDDEVGCAVEQLAGWRAGNSDD